MGQRERDWSAAASFNKLFFIPLHRSLVVFVCQELFHFVSGLLVFCVCVCVCMYVCRTSPTRCCDTAAVPLLVTTHKTSVTVFCSFYPVTSLVEIQFIKSLKYSGLIGTQEIRPKTIHTLRLQFTARINSVHIDRIIVVHTSSQTKQMVKQ